MTILIGNAKGQYLGAESGDAARWEIDYGQDQPTWKLFRLVVNGELSAGLLDANFRPKVNTKFVSRLSRPRQRPGRDDAPDPNVYVLKILYSDGLCQGNIFLFW